MTRAAVVLALTLALPPLAHLLALVGVEAPEARKDCVMLLGGGLCGESDAERQGCQQERKTAKPH